MTLMTELVDLDRQRVAIEYRKYDENTTSNVLSFHLIC